MEISVFFLMQNEALLGVITLLHVSPGATSRTVKKKKNEHWCSSMVAVDGAPKGSQSL